MTGLASTLATIWRLAAPYFRSEDRLAGRLLLGAVVCIELTIVAINVMINQWNARFYNALQDRNWRSQRAWLAPGSCGSCLTSTSTAAPASSRLAPP